MNGDMQEVVGVGFDEGAGGLVVDEDAGLGEAVGRALVKGDVECEGAAGGDVGDFEVGLEVELLGGGGGLDGFGG